MSRPLEVSDRGPAASRRAMISSKATSERPWLGPSNSATARARASCAARSSRFTASCTSVAGWAEARAAASRRPAATHARAVALRRFALLVLATRTPSLLLPVAQHALRPVVVHEDGPRRVDGDRLRPPELGAGDRGQGLGLRS